MEDKVTVEAPIDPALQEKKIPYVGYLIFALIFILIFPLGAVRLLFGEKKVEGPLYKLVENSTSEPTISAKPKDTKSENLSVINGDFKLTYLRKSNPSYLAKEYELKNVDFKSKGVKQYSIPLGEDFRKIRISPNGKFIAKVTNKKLDIAPLGDEDRLVFKTVHEVPVVTSPESQVKDADFAHMNDAMWDNAGNLFFITSLGNDAMSNPLGVYTDIYVANEDGSNPKLINDHAKQSQNYGFMKHFNSINTGGNIFLGGSLHAGHAAPIIIINSKNGEIVKRLTESGNVSSDFSKLYYFADEKGQTGDIQPYQIIEEDIVSGNKKIKFTLPSAQTYLTESYFDRENNKLYVNTIKGKEYKSFDYSIYILDLKSESTKVLLTSKKSCSVLGVSKNEDILFMRCSGPEENSLKYYFYQVSSGNWSVFYDGTDEIEVLSFE